METTKGLFSQDEIDKLAESKNIDISKLPPREQREKENIERFNKSLRIKKGRKYFSLSIWPGDVPLHFSFKSWKPEIQSNVDQAKKLGNQAFSLSKMIAGVPANIALSGEKGTGKTSLALAIMYAAKSQGLGVMFVSTDELAELVGKQYDLTDIKSKLDDIERAMKEVDVLVLDDFGTEGGMKNDIKPVRKDMQEFMYRVANARVDFEHNKAKKSTIITTNNSKKQLEKMYNEKLISRLMTNDPDRQLAFSDMQDVRGV